MHNEDNNSKQNIMLNATIIIFKKIIVEELKEKVELSKVQIKRVESSDILVPYYRAKRQVRRLGPILRECEQCISEFEGIQDALTHEQQFEKIGQLMNKIKQLIKRIPKK